MCTRWNPSSGQFVNTRFRVTAEYLLEISMNFDYHYA